MYLTSENGSRKLLGHYPYQNEACYTALSEIENETRNLPNMKNIYKNSAGEKRTCPIHFLNKQKTTKTKINFFAHASFLQVLTGNNFRFKEATFLRPGIMEIAVSCKGCFQVKEKKQF